jgi:DNA-binding transcriptional ArsR family regulator
MIQTLTTEARNALSITPTRTPIETVERAFDPAASLREWNVLIVAYGDSHRALRAAWRERIEESPAGFGTIVVGSTVGDHRSVDPVSRTGYDVTATVRSPADLAELGTTISLYLDDWTAGSTLVCFHSLEDLLASVGTETAFQFLHVLTRRLSGADAVSQFSIDPAAVDEATVRTLEPIFDTVTEEHDEESPSITPDTAFDVLRAPRRRYALHYLHEHTGSVTITELSEWVARHEPDADAERVEVSLHHSHLPKLEDAGLVSLVETRVSGRSAIEALVPYLELVSEHDLPE